MSKKASAERMLEAAADAINFVGQANWPVGEVAALAWVTAIYHRKTRVSIERFYEIQESEVIARTG